MAVVSNDQVQSIVVTTDCVYRTLSAAAIVRYLAIDLPFDTAGSAKAECLGIALMQSMHSSDPTAIIGLPLIELTRMLAKVGLDLCSPAMRDRDCARARIRNRGATRLRDQPNIEACAQGLQPAL